jgi:hypothetical protein
MRAPTGVRVFSISVSPYLDYSVAGADLNHRPWGAAAPLP